MIDVDILLVHLVRGDSRGSALIGISALKTSSNSNLGETVGCPICAEDTKRFESDVRMVLEHTDQVVVYRFCYCTTCDFSFVENPLSELELQEYYRSSTRLNRETITIEEAKHLQEQMQMLSEAVHLSRDIRILEVGPGYGDFLRLLREVHGIEPYFVEYNEDCRKFLISEGFEPREFEVIETFDVIVIRHVLEHVPNPLHYLKIAKSKLSNKGIIFIEVPDYSMVSSKFVDGFQIEHVNYFSLISLARVARFAGMDCVASAIGRTPNYSTSPNRVLRVCFRNANFDGTDPNTIEHWERKIAEHSIGYRNLETFCMSDLTRRVAIYGAGTRTREFQAYLGGKWQAPAVFDIDPRKIGTILLGRTVSHANDLHPEQFDVIVNMTEGYTGEVMRFLQQKNVRKSATLQFGEFLNMVNDS